METAKNTKPRLKDRGQHKTEMCLTGYSLAAAFGQPAQPPPSPALGQAAG